MAYKLSVLIPAREEHIYDIDLLAETVTNCLANTSEQTQIVVVLDGYQPPTLVVDSRVTYIHHSKSIGQRAATNEAARIAQGEWVCKLDAHCALSPDFDTKLLDGAEPDWTIVPAQYNLLAYVWKCRKCGWLKDQSGFKAGKDRPDRCDKCGSRYLKQVNKWVPRDGRDGSDVDRSSGKRNTRLTSWRFDTNLEYSQWGEWSNRQSGKFIDTLSLLGACWAIRRDRYFQLDMSDERYGSWGQQGTEVACKSWLSGGSLKCNTDTWFAHFFRVGGLKFPYPGGGMKERAMARCREMWLNNKWEHQTRPLSSLIEQFAPVPDWRDDHPVWQLVKTAGEKFIPRANSFLSAGGGISSPLTNSTVSSSLVGSEQGMTQEAGSLSSVDGSGNLVTSPDVIPVIIDQGDVGRVTTGLVFTDDVIQDGNTSLSAALERSNKPSVHKPMGELGSSFVVDMPVPPLVSGSTPDPATRVVDNDSTEQRGEPTAINVPDNQKIHSVIVSQNVRKGALYYSCLSHDPILEQAGRNNLKQATNGHELGVVTLNERIDFGDWQVVVQREKSGTTMHYQILEGLRRSRADYVFLCESDVFYHPSHFDFTPPRDDTFYYNTNVWRVRYQDGHAVRTDNLQQVSGICASRTLLLEHYRKRIELIEANGGQFNVKQMAYEPGTRGDKWGSKVANWESAYPNIDITGHGNTLTTPHFSIDSFRNKRYAEGWQETDEQIAGWPLLAGRVQEFLTELANG